MIQKKFILLFLAHLVFPSFGYAQTPYVTTPPLAPTAPREPTPQEILEKAKTDKCQDLIIDSSRGPNMIFINQFNREVGRYEKDAAPKNLKFAISDCDEHYFYVDISEQALKTKITNGHYVGGRAAVLRTDVFTVTLKSLEVVPKAVNPTKSTTKGTTKTKKK